MKISIIRGLTSGSTKLADFAPDTVLSRNNMMMAMSKFQAQPLIRMHTDEPKRKAAVLIPLCVVDGKVSLLYTLRTSSMRSHKGQVSFPGGMQDEKDRSLQFTALRETREELGINESDVTLWGQGNSIVARSEMSVLPVVATINENLNLKELEVNPAEVECVFTVPLLDLCRGEKTGYTQFKSGYALPVFFGAPKRIWGLTAVITNTFLKCLLPHHAYAHKIKYVQSVKRSNLKK